MHAYGLRHNVVFATTTSPLSINRQKFYRQQPIMCHIARSDTPPRMNKVQKLHLIEAIRGLEVRTENLGFKASPFTAFDTSISRWISFFFSGDGIANTLAEMSTIEFLGGQSKAFQQRRRTRIDQDANKRLTTMAQSFMDLLPQSLHPFYHDNSPRSSRAFQRMGHKCFPFPFSDSNVDDKPLIWFPPDNE
ncbi:uncharacterized protein EAF02_001513 [Botrytis sinoallii]|uniref:uncharacterized protein n=1 Tax=Botrytis sinoallii TaxID=1463999 RepID=UPI001901E397|nr:uncharacterized protein EAF02_001513 [Botrytis sinoallii]KAF7891188.1 hypothetical protein EAF02_001513 [Botrytis sinoallii]